MSLMGNGNRVLDPQRLLGQHEATGEIADDTGMTIIEELEAIRRISELKARYFRFIDTQNWDGLRDCFTDDALLWYPEAGMTDYAPARDLLPAMKDFMHGAVSGHQGYMPEIDFVADDHATGIWAMQDFVSWPPDRAVALDQEFLSGCGHYHEEYVRQQGRWRICRLKLTRLRFQRRRPAVAIV